MKLSIYQVDAFTDKIFGGNPAAVIPLEQWLEDKLMQQLAAENNLSETVFIVPAEDDESDYSIRWFTPANEINLCGHATLATAFVLFNYMDFNKTEIVFSSKSGLLKIAANNGLISMDFPSWKPERTEDYPKELQEILGNLEIIGVYKYRDLLVELQDEDAVRHCTPDFSLMQKFVDKMIITAPASKKENGKTPIDFVSRFFAPGEGINEDPVTGSAHAQLIPFWSDKFRKKKMIAQQLSKRKGTLYCEQLNADRVMISGQAVFYMKGEISLEL